MSFQAPKKITLKRKLDDVQSNAPDVLYLEGRKLKFFKRVEGERPVTPKRRHISTCSQLPVHRAGSDPRSINIDDERAPHPVNNSAPSRPQTAGNGNLRYYLSRRKREFATFEAESDRPSKRRVSTVWPEKGSTELSSSPRKKPSGTTRLPQRPPESERQNAHIPSALSASHPPTPPANAVFQNMLDEAEVPASTLSVRNFSSRKPLTPRAPAVRMKDRLVHPSATSKTEDEMKVDGADEPGYIYETYVLDDAMEFDIASAAPGSVGILMIEEEDRPLWETYIDWEEPESDEHEPSDEEDENAENYYGADYPEDEVDSDDEHDINPYRFQHGDASDEDDYCSDGPTFSDDEDEDGGSKPWNKLRHTD